MNFYVIANGYGGDGYCRVYVAAENEKRAKELASKVFREESERYHPPSYPLDYHDISALTVICQLPGDSEGTNNYVD